MVQCIFSKINNDTVQTGISLLGTSGFANVYVINNNLFACFNVGIMGNLSRPLRMCKVSSSFSNTFI